MKAKLVGALTGLLVGIGLIFVLPAGAQAATWSNYVTGTHSIGIKQSGTGTVYQNRGRIYGPGGGVGYTAKFTVKVASPKGAITTAGATVSGVWYYQNATGPQSNTIGRCELAGPYHPLGGDYLCDVYK